eukprot:TRINITY_DN10041_c0_g1_i1.p1 TRINITY_DN10041_c0_g1~~TRINITY_DN10041_c0_g1_i1.p1  ORF type:complete len:304 (+),score=70.65 TRINITY_DN10041_c0_g1_i1:14-925(+)
MATRQYVIPQKQIHAISDMEKWKRSNTYHAYEQFVTELNDAAIGKKNSDACLVTPIIERSIAILDKLDKLVDDTPPTSQPTRYGNKAFRDWLAKVQESEQALMKEVLPEEFHDASIELGPYFTNSFGNSTRIDYGTGHEANFTMWMCCMRALGLFTSEDSYALVSRLFLRYLSLMRKIQKTYLLEPAGSHGVWGLDDYQFLPFVWGSAQLVGHSLIRPNSIHQKDMVESYADEYLYMGCIKFTTDIKKGPFGEHSPYLNDISHVPHQLWEKVNRGMLTIYKKEVMDKFPVIQHFLFGSIFPFA